MSFYKEIEHLYGKNVHILDNPFCFGLLAELCHPDTYQPNINRIVELLYHQLISIVSVNEFDSENFKIDSRMTQHHPSQHIEGQRINRRQKAVTVNLARAGTFPSHICYNFLHHILDPKNIRQDHIFAARKTNENDAVTGAEFGGMKIGGDVKDSIVLLPDPMGATGSTMVNMIDHYKKHIQGPAKKYIALNLIITPEYVRNLTSAHPEVIIYCLRLDRGLSSQAALNSIPGKLWNEERGLNDHQYIVPGGGGFGELLNNSFV